MSMRMADITTNPRARSLLKRAKTTATQNQAQNKQQQQQQAQQQAQAQQAQAAATTQQQQSQAAATTQPQPQAAATTAQQVAQAPATTPQQAATTNQPVAAAPQSTTVAIPPTSTSASFQPSSSTAFSSSLLTSSSALPSLAIIYTQPITLQGASSPIAVAEATAIPTGLDSSSADGTSTSTSTIHIVAIVFGVLGGVILTVLFLLAICLCKKRRQRRAGQHSSTCCGSRKTSRAYSPAASDSEVKAYRPGATPERDLFSNGGLSVPILPGRVYNEKPAESIDGSSEDEVMAAPALRRPQSSLSIRDDLRPRPPLGRPYSAQDFHSRQYTPSGALLTPHRSPVRSFSERMAMADQPMSEEDEIESQRQYERAEAERLRKIEEHHWRRMNAIASVRSPSSGSARMSTISPVSRHSTVSRTGSMSMYAPSTTRPLSRGLSHRSLLLTVPAPLSPHAQ